MDSKVIRVYESFRLGYCRCACGTEIKLKNKTSSYLLRYALNHHTKGKEGIKGFRNGNWKGGRTKKGDYWYIRIDGEYKLEHVYFYEQKNKVCVMPWCVVHHIDENKENNMPWNLTTMFWGEHTSYHSTIDKSGRRCSNEACTTPIDNYKSDWYYNENKEFICNRCYLKEYRNKNKK